MNTLIDRYWLYLVAGFTVCSVSLGVVAEQVAHIGYAKVVSVTPAYTVIEELHPQERCWIEKVRNETRHSAVNPEKGKVIGGLVGGVLGYAVGRGHSNKKLGALVGGVIGASIGHQHDRDSSQPSRTTVSFRNVERCKVVDVLEKRRELAGYDVEYRYDGKTFKSRMLHHPDDELKVTVTVVPVP